MMKGIYYNIFKVKINSIKFKIIFFLIFGYILFRGVFFDRIMANTDEIQSIIIKCYYILNSRYFFMGVGLPCFLLLLNMFTEALSDYKVMIRCFSIKDYFKKHIVCSLISIVVYLFMIDFGIILISFLKKNAISIDFTIFIFIILANISLFLGLFFLSQLYIFLTIWIKNIYVSYIVIYIITFLDYLNKTNTYLFDIFIVNKVLFENINIITYFSSLLKLGSYILVLFIANYSILKMKDLKL